MPRQRKVGRLRDRERRSRIVFSLTPGNIVTTPRSDVMYVVTEFGMVNLKGKSVAERAQAIICLAHPDFREDLERQPTKTASFHAAFRFLAGKTKWTKLIGLQNLRQPRTD